MTTIQEKLRDLNKNTLEESCSLEVLKQRWQSQGPGVVRDVLEKANNIQQAKKYIKYLTFDRDMKIVEKAEKIVKSLDELYEILCEGPDHRDYKKTQQLLKRLGIEDNSPLTFDDLYH